MKSKSFVAFLDMLATKQSLDIGHDHYFSLLKIFRQTMEACSSKLDDDDEIFMFSDCAYVGFKRLDNFAEFFNHIQKFLMAQNLFFRCAVVEGKIESKKAKNQTYGAKLQGFTFGAKAVDAFLLHENFKGIGSVVSSEIFDSKSHIRPFFFKTTHRNSATLCHAFKLKFDSFEEEHKLLEGFANEFLLQSTISKRIGRYYVSLLSTWLMSSDLSDLEVIQQDYPKTNKPIIDLLLNNHHFYKNLIEVPGGELVVFSLFSQLLKNDHEHEELLDLTALRIGSRKSLRNQIAHVPVSILSETEKRKLVEKIV